VIYGLTIFMQDVTGMRKMTESNKLNELRYSALFHGSSDAIFIADVATRKIVDLNLKASELIGYNKESIVGNPISFIHPADELELVSTTFRKFSESKDDVAGAECHVLHQSGKKIPVAITAGRAFNIEGKNYSAAYFKDLRGEKEVEKKIERISDLLKRAELIAQIGSSEINIRTGERIWSDGFYRILGYEPGSVTPAKNLFTDLMHPEDRPKYLVWFDATSKTPMDPIEIRVIRKDGNLRYLYLSGKAYQDEQGDLNRYIGVAVDVTQRKMLEMNLIKSNQQLENLTNMIPIAIIEMETDKTGHVKMNFISKGISRIYEGLTPEQVLSCPNLITDWVIEEDKQMLMDLYHESIRELNDLNVEFRIRDLNGHQRWVKLLYHPEQTEEGGIVWYGYIEDISANMEFLHTLEAQNERLRDIAWTQSHIVRAPLARLMGLVSALERGVVSEEDLPTFYQYINFSAMELESVIRDIMSKTIT